MNAQQSRVRQERLTKNKSRQSLIIYKRFSGMLKKVVDTFLSSMNYHKAWLHMLRAYGSQWMWGMDGGWIKIHPYNMFRAYGSGRK